MQFNTKDLNPIPCWYILMFESFGWLEMDRSVESREQQGNTFEALSEPEVEEAHGSWLQMEGQEVKHREASPLHLACREGQLETVRRLTRSSSALCFCRDKNGGTPLHVAAMKGRVDVIKLLLEACPESVKEVTATGETCLHTAVAYNRCKATLFLVKWIGRSNDYASLINAKDTSGNTALHLAASRKQLQTLKVLLSNEQNTSNLVDVNATNSGGFTALDILHVLPFSGKIDMEIHRLLRGAGALRATDIAQYDTKIQTCCGRQYYRPPYNTINHLIKPRREIACCVLLVTATLLATITYHVGGTLSLKEAYSNSYSKKDNLQLRKAESVTIKSFIVFNSTGFVSSIAIIIFLLHEFPLKPWPQLSVSTLFASYICLTAATSPDEAMVLLFLAVPFLLLAAAGKLYGFSWHSRVSSCELDRSGLIC